MVGYQESTATRGLAAQLELTYDTESHLLSCVNKLFTSVNLGALVSPLSTTTNEPRLSLLIELSDKAGALHSTLAPFAEYGVNITHIESRPIRRDSFNFYVDCEGVRGDRNIEAVLTALEEKQLNVLILDYKKVPWFPRQIVELDLIGDRILLAKSELDSDHPGFKDAKYRERRAQIDALARGFVHGQPIPMVKYSQEELGTWSKVFLNLHDLHRLYACPEYIRVFEVMEKECGYSENNIPQGRDVSAFLELRTGFRLRPVAGLLSQRDFLNGLAFRVFFCTQYVRHHSKPFYTPEPDVCHELIGHAPMLADPSFADLSQEIGLASLGASEPEIERLARCYWHSVEFGLIENHGQLKAYGAGLLSSYGELKKACSHNRTANDIEPNKALQPWNPSVAALQEYPVTDYQPVYFVADSVPDAMVRMREYCRHVPRPFHARYNPTTEQIWIDRAVVREPNRGD